MTKHTHKNTPSELRIIGGKFRSRKITFIEENGLRPTHDRIRETLFNWLQNAIENSMCLDIFAGSGALGFEAISRGAKEVTFCDLSYAVMSHLKSNAEKLHINNAIFSRSDFMLENPVQNKQFDIVFCDPPFEKNLILATCALLESRELLAENAVIYLEFKKGTVDLHALPKNWTIQKHKSTQTLEYVLCQKIKMI